MSTRKKAIQDMDLLANSALCDELRLPLTPQTKRLLLQIAEKRLASSTPHYLKKSPTETRQIAFNLWLKSPEGAKMWRLAVNEAANYDSNYAKKWLDSRFDEAHPEYKLNIGRPAGSINKNRLVLLEASAIITEMLNRLVK